MDRTVSLPDRKRLHSNNVGTKSGRSFGSIPRHKLLGYSPQALGSYCSLHDRFEGLLLALIPCDHSGERTVYVSGQLVVIGPGEAFLFVGVILPSRSHNSYRMPRLQ